MNVLYEPAQIPIVTPNCCPFQSIGLLIGDTHEQLDEYDVEEVNTDD